MTSLHREIAACTICAKHLPHGVRPIAQFSATSRLVIIGQAPGSAVHASGVPWDDPSGDRLREWTRLSKREMYNPKKVALVPMGFCYPGKGKSGDLPPRPECAPAWHERVMSVLPDDALTLLVGSYAQAAYLPHTKKLTLTKRVEKYEEFLPAFLPLPHPSWRSTGWMRKNPWFEETIVPDLQTRVRSALS